jgi:hypothetical protein
VPPDARPTSPHPPRVVDDGRARLPPPPLVPRALGARGSDDAPPSPRRSVAAVERQIAEMAGAPGSASASSASRTSKTRETPCTRRRPATTTARSKRPHRTVTSSTTSARGGERARPCHEAILLLGSHGSDRRRARPAPRKPSSARTHAQRAPDEPGDQCDPVAAHPGEQRIGKGWHELIEAAKHEGQEVRHCGSLPCAGGACGIASCVCHCEGCDRIAALLARARRDVGDHAATRDGVQTTNTRLDR